LIIDENIVFAFHNVSNRFNLGLNNISIKKFIKFSNFLISNYKNSRICFDDGYEDIYTNVFPMNLNIKKVLFPITNYIGKENSWDVNFYINRKKHISREQIIESFNNGWIIGSHGHSHKSYIKLSNEIILNDLIKSKEILEDIIKHPIDIFTPPFGYLNQTHINLIAKAGYKEIYLNSPYINLIKDPLDIKLLRRINIYSIDTIKSVDKRIIKNQTYQGIENLIHKCSKATVFFKN